MKMDNVRLLIIDNDGV